MSGEQQRQLYEALLSAFPDAGSLRRMVQFGLDQNLDVIADTSKLSDAVFELIQWAESRGKITKLIIAARNSNPDNPALRKVAEELHLAPDTSELESIVIPSVGFTDVEVWRVKMNRCELAVCRVEMPGGGFGTGFLIAPDVVVTNYHVVKNTILGVSDPKDVVLRFDYKTDESGTAVQLGQEYKLATDWLITSSSPGDLDYALLRVDGKPGEAPVAGQRGAPNRGWLAPQHHNFTIGEPLIIIQHPRAQPLKVSAGGALDYQTSPPRILHSVSTLRGSSGSPCFTSDWTLVALHHAGTPSHNQAIPFSAILTELQKIPGLLK